MKKIIFLILTLNLSLSYAEDISFTCSGIMNSTEGKKTTQYDSGRFDLILNTSSGEISGFPNFMALGCFHSEKENFSMTPLSAITECVSKDGSKSTLRMSRNTGDLKITTTKKWVKSFEYQEGTFSCEKVTNKVF